MPVDLRVADRRLGGRCRATNSPAQPGGGQESPVVEERGELPASAACPALAVRIGASRPPVAGVAEKVRHGPGHRPERELEILCPVAAGASNGQVASAMNISGHIVAGSLRSMLSRTWPPRGDPGPVLSRTVWNRPRMSVMVWGIVRGGEP